MIEMHSQLIETAFATHRGALVRRLTALTRDPATAEDLAQEAFLRLAREVEAGRTPDDIRAWLHRVGANLVASRGRHLTVANRRDAELEPPAILPDPELEAVQAELNGALRRGLAELPASDRRALVLAAHGYQGPEIAALIGRTPGATRTLLCRARAKLRDTLSIAGYAPA